MSTPNVHLDGEGGESLAATVLLTKKVTALRLNPTILGVSVAVAARCGADRYTPSTIHRPPLARSPSVVALASMNAIMKLAVIATSAAVPVGTSEVASQSTGR